VNKLSRSAEKIIYNYLACKDSPLSQVDAVIAFGHFDLEIPKQALNAYLDYSASWIFLAGGIGAGTADLKKPEALAFYDAIIGLKPDFPSNRIVMESASTNTSENILFLSKAMAENDKALHFGKEIMSVILVASPVRQRRVMLTVRNFYPQLKIYNFPPSSDIDTEKSKHESKGIGFRDLLIGEIQRLMDYPKKGFIAEEPMPLEVLEAYHVLRNID
jgi:uncharacterized SAM-binding protein YcdF (DUF218 family)